MKTQLSFEKVLLALALCFTMSAAAPTASFAAKKEKAAKAEKKAAGGEWKQVAEGLKVRDEKVGTGAEAVAGKELEVHYTGWLKEGDKRGAKFDSSVDRGPFKFRLGSGMVIQGWDKGFAGMKEGGKRTLLISPEMGYGARGAGGVIPPNATLEFEVELLKVLP